MDDNELIHKNIRWLCIVAISIVAAICLHNTATYIAYCANGYVEELVPTTARIVTRKTK